MGTTALQDLGFWGRGAKAVMDGMGDTSMEQAKQVH